MSVGATRHVWQYYPKQGPKFLVMLAVADDAVENRFEFDLATLGRKCRLAQTQLRSLLDDLIDEGWLTKEDTFYRINLIGETLMYEPRKTVARKDDTVQINEMVAMYFDNFPDNLIKPGGGQIASQVKHALKQLSPAQLMPLIIKVAQDGLPLSRNTLLMAQNNSITKNERNLTELSREIRRLELEGK